METREVVVPALSEEQKYWTAKVLIDVCGVDWKEARTLVARTPGVVYTSADAELVEKIVGALLNRAGVAPQVRLVFSDKPREPTTDGIIIRKLTANERYLLGILGFLAVVLTATIVVPAIFHTPSRRLSPQTPGVPHEFFQAYLEISSALTRAFARHLGPASEYGAAVADANAFLRRLSQKWPNVAPDCQRRIQDTIAYFESAGRLRGVYEEKLSDERFSFGSRQEAWQDYTNGVRKAWEEFKQADDICHTADLR